MLEIFTQKRVEIVGFITDTYILSQVGGIQYFCHPWRLSFGQAGQLLSNLVRFNQGA